MDEAVYKALSVYGIPSWAIVTFPSLPTFMRYVNC